MTPVPTDLPATDPGELPDPSGEYAFEQHYDRVALEKEAARRAPDIPWATWWFRSGSKWYVGLGFLILDVWLFASVLPWIGLGLAIVTTAVALYAEFLLYRYLYFLPGDDDEPRRGPFRPTWTRPVEYGRWTAEGAAVRAGGTVVTPEAGPDPKEFL